MGEDGAQDCRSEWRGYALCVPPLDLRLAVTERRGLTERAAGIRALLEG